MKKKLKTKPVSNPPDGEYTPEGLRWLEEQIAPLASGCPWTKRNPAECPLCGVRELPPAEVARWLARLTPQEKEYLVLYHQCCLATRWQNEVLERYPVRSASEEPKAAARPAVNRRRQTTAVSRSRR